MDQAGFTHAWINAMLGLVAGMLMVSFNRWPNYRWLVIYLFYGSVSSILFLGIPVLNQAELLKLASAIGYLFLLATAAEISRVSYRKEPVWTLPAFALIAGSAFFLPASGPSFVVPHIFLFGGLVLAMGKAIRSKNLPYFALSLSAFGVIVSDLMKLASLQVTGIPPEFQTAVSLWWASAVFAIFLGGLIAPELSVLTREAAMLRGSLGRQELTSPVAVTVPGAGRGESGESLEGYLKKAAVASSLSHNDYLTFDELCVFLSSPDAVTRSFVEDNGIRKVFPVGDASNWLVSKKDVREALVRAGFLADND